MFKLLSLLFLVLFILLTPPAVLAYISQDAVPGDITYPIKRKLEDGIVVLASVNPTTKAIFSVDRSGRRYKESSILLAKGQVPVKTLSELVIQTKQASDEVSQVTNPNEKRRLQQELENSINKYIQGLTDAKKLVKDENPDFEFETDDYNDEDTTDDTDDDENDDSDLENPTPHPSPSTSTFTPSPKPTPTQPAASTKVNPTPTLTPTLAPSPTLTPRPEKILPQCEKAPDPIQCTISELEKILANQKKSSPDFQEALSESDKELEKDNKSDVYDEQSLKEVGKELKAAEILYKKTRNKFKTSDPKIENLIAQAKTQAEIARLSFKLASKQNVQDSDTVQPDNSSQTFQEAFLDYQSTVKSLKQAVKIFSLTQNQSPNPTITPTSTPEAEVTPEPTKTPNPTDIIQVNQE